MALIKEYFRLHDEYEAEYGDRTVLLYQVGTFYNMYTTDENQLVLDIANLIGFRITLMNTENKVNMGSRENPYMVGIPTISYEKYRDIILSNDYRVISHRQSKTDTNKRELFENLTPLTVSNISSSHDKKDTAKICVIYIECVKGNVKPEDNPLLVGISFINMITGQIEIKDIYTDGMDSRHPINEIYRLLIANRPKEIQIYVSFSGDDESKSRLEKYLMESLELSTYPIINISFNINKNYLDVHYQCKYLEKIYRKVNDVTSPVLGSEVKTYKGAIMDIFSELELTHNHYGTISYIMLLEYCNQNNALLGHKVKKPVSLESTNKLNLSLAYNAAIQLNIVSTNINKINYRIIKRKNYESLLDVLDSTCTSMGKRAIRDRLLNPITDPVILTQRYNAIEFLKDNMELTAKLGSCLRQLYDIERLNLRLLRGLIKPKDFCNLFSSYKDIIEMINGSVGHLVKSVEGRVEPSALYFIFPKNEELKILNKTVQDIYTTFNIETLRECNVVDNTFACRVCPLNPGRNPECDNYQNNLWLCENKLSQICSHLQNVIGGSTNVEVASFAKKVNKGKSIQDDEDEELINMEDLGIYLTKDKATKLANNLSRVDKELCGIIKLESRNKKYMVKSDIIDGLCKYILLIRNELSVYMYKMYTEYIDFVSKTYDLSNIVQFIINMDILLSSTKNAIKFGYHKPQIVQSDKLFIDVKDLRHPLVERIVSTEYVPNDISINGNGILLFGCNSTGKSVLTTSVPLAIIMAQAGMWVPGIMKFSIVNRIITRLSGQDDIIKGHSSFVVEMLELRNILRNADKNTLVLGDELCRGTEGLSGGALMISTLEHLTERNIPFIFSTHLHDIPNQKRVKKLLEDGSLRIFHLQSIYDPVLGELIYNRKLMPGPGESIYGLEVAKSLDIDNKFIKNAFDIRKELLGEPIEFVNTKKSPYNSQVFVDECELCIERRGIESHHIKEQNLANKDGLIGHIPKNASYNIFTVCRNCHRSLHEKNLMLQPIFTATGTTFKIVSKNEFK